MIKPTAVVLLAGLASACVTKGKYNALQKQLDETRFTAPTRARAPSGPSSRTPTTR